MVSSFEIRRAKKNDLPAIIRLAKDPALVEADGKSYPGWIASFIQPKQFPFVATSGKKIVGFILGERLMDRGCLVHLIVVEKPHRRKGLGQQLIKFLEIEARKKGIHWFLFYAFEKHQSIKKLLKRLNYSAGSHLQEYQKVVGPL